MKRVVLSIVGGVLIPVFLVLLLMAGEGLGLTLPVWLNDAIVYFIYWPLIPLSKVLPYPLAMPGGDQPWPGVLVVWLMAHFVFFATCTYAALWLRARRRFR